MNCDANKQNESELANIDIDIGPIAKQMEKKNS